MLDRDRQRPAPHVFAHTDTCITVAIAGPAASCLARLPDVYRESHPGATAPPRTPLGSTSQRGR